jgi:transposase, IS5 family
MRIYFLQQRFNLSDPTVEEARCDSAEMRQFVDIALGCEPLCRRRRTSTTVNRRNVGV